MRFFTSNFFFLRNQPDFTDKNMPKIAKVKLSSCGFEVADFRKIVIAELRSCGCGATFLYELQKWDCGSASFRLQNCDCGLKKKLYMPTSVNLALTLQKLGISVTFFSNDNQLIKVNIVKQAVSRVS
jgi:hypothetical protein